MLTIGLIREGKTPEDRRVALTPAQAARVQSTYPHVKIVCQPSPHRCYTNEEYEKHGITISEDMAACDVLMGVKEVPVDLLIPGKTYFFFSHTIKKQGYNKLLLQSILQKNITLLDYEVLIDEYNKRVVAFGRFAGIVGAYNALWAFGQRYNLYSVKRAWKCHDLEELKNELTKIKLPPIKIVLTGGGRVSKGALEILYGLNLRKVSPLDFVKLENHRAIFTQLNSRDYHKRKDGGPFARSHFFKHPEKYESRFLRYAKKADILIAGAFWDPRAPEMFTPEDMIKNNFHLKIIADISCDIDGPIPSTVKATTIQDPLYDFNPSDCTLEPPLSDEANVTVMAIDNLPNELPRDASEAFGEQLITHVIPKLATGKEHAMLENATIAKNGSLTKTFEYLSEYVKA